MKKLVLFTTMLFTFVTTFSQDILILKHTNYTSHFSKSKKYPVIVEWWETKAKVSCPNPLPRKDAFQPDPQAILETDIKADYVGSGYDRGHMSPAASNQCQTAGVQIESFYMSNMAAQTHRLNAGDWKSLEVLTREWASKYDSVRIWAGNVGEITRATANVSATKTYSGDTALTSGQVTITGVTVSGNTEVLTSSPLYIP